MVSFCSNPEEADDNTYEKRMKRINRMNYVRIFLLALKSIPYGYYISIFNPIGSILMRDVYGLDKDHSNSMLGNINMFYALGGFFSVLTAGPLSELLGRRKLIIILDISNIFVISLYSIKSLFVLQAVRFFSGWISAGLGMVSNIYITECLPKKLSGVANSTLYACNAAALFFAYIQQKIFTDEQMVANWRLILCWPIIPALFKAIFLPFVIKRESPKFFIKNNENLPELKERLNDIYKDTYRHSQVVDITEGTIKVFNDQKKAAPNQGFSILFTKLMRRRLMTAVLVAMSEEMCGMTYFSLYSTDLFNRINGTGKQMTFTIALTKLCAGIVAVFCMKFFGRKTNLTVSPLIQCIALILIITSITLSIPVLAYFGVVTFMLFYAIGFGGSTTNYITEIVPPKGASIGYSIIWLFSAGLGKILPFLSGFMGDESLLISFAISCFIIFIVMGTVLIETKDKSEAKIIDEFVNKKIKFFDFK